MFIIKSLVLDLENDGIKILEFKKINKGDKNGPYKEKKRK